MKPGRVKPLDRLARRVRQADVGQASSIEVVRHARVPILKYVDRASGVPVDISINSTDGSRNSR